MSQFDLATTSFLSILESRPDEPGVLISLAQTYLGLGLEEKAGGFLSRAEASFRSAVEAGLRFLSDGKGAGASGVKSLGWKVLGDALFYLSRFSEFGEDEVLRPLLEEVSTLVGSTDTGGRLEGIVDLPLQIPSEEEPLKGINTLMAAILAYNHRITLGLLNSTAVGSAWYDLGSASRSFATEVIVEEKKEKAERQTTACLMEAIKANPIDETYWIALGNMHFAKQPKTAQHAYIKALEINNKVRSTFQCQYSIAIYTLK